jgi:hypothetical protein
MWPFPTRAQVLMKAAEFQLQKEQKALEKELKKIGKWVSKNPKQHPPQSDKEGSR